jgi:hypothetical protein
MPRWPEKPKNENKTAPVKAPIAMHPQATAREELKKSISDMEANLNSQPKVSIMIPLEKGEKKGATQPFCINGYKFKVPKGMMTQVPEQVAEMIAERFNVELEIRGQSLDQRDTETKKALEL